MQHLNLAHIKFVFVRVLDMLSPLHCTHLHLGFSYLHIHFAFWDFAVKVDAWAVDFKSNKLWMLKICKHFTFVDHWITYWRIVYLYKWQIRFWMHKFHKIGEDWLKRIEQLTESESEREFVLQDAELESEHLQAFRRI